VPAASAGQAGQDRRCSASARIPDEKAVFAIMEILAFLQSVFSVAALRRDRRQLIGGHGRAGALKTDWAKPLHDARLMGIEWLAEF